MTQKIEKAIPENISAKVKYAVLTSDGVKKMSTLEDGKTHKAECIIRGSYIDTRSGEERQFCAMEVEGVLYRTPSDSFIRGVDAYIQCFPDAVPVTFTVGSAKSAKGNTYILFQPVLDA